MDLTASLEAFNRQTAEGCVKVTEDLARYRHVLTAARPDVIVECGSYNLHSAVWFARTAHCHVITIDVISWRDPADVAAAVEAGVTIVVGSSTSPTVVDRVHKWAAGRRAMVVLDSDHSGPHVLAELEAYTPLVPTGSYAVVEDGIVRDLPPMGYDGSPLDAIEAFLPGHPEFTVDADVEAMFPATMHPSGWLRRS